MRSSAKEEIVRIQKALLESAKRVDASRKKMRETHVRLLETTKELLEDLPLRSTPSLLDLRRAAEDLRDVAERVDKWRDPLLASPAPRSARMQSLLDIPVLRGPLPRRK